MIEKQYQTPIFLKGHQSAIGKHVPLPKPVGEYPYRLNINDILPEKSAAFGEMMSFHLLGDTGSARHSTFQSIVSKTMGEQLNDKAGDGLAPSFLYHVGDIVYNHGEEREYPAQFFTPYSHYAAPIFAIPGNHDGDINPAVAPYESLSAFTKYFCAPKGELNSSADANRRMCQPHCFWTLETPLARFIGVYSNVSKYGSIDTEQEDWFVEELKYAAQFKDQQAIFVTIHHAPFTADTNHGSSQVIIDFLHRAFEKSGVRPDAVFSGHVHNYQRFVAEYDNGSKIPFIISGAGGYADLHRLAKTNDIFVEPVTLPDVQVDLKAFSESSFGFLQMSIVKTSDQLWLNGKYYAFSSLNPLAQDIAPVVLDSFAIPLRDYSGEVQEVFSDRNF